MDENEKAKHFRIDAREWPADKRLALARTFFTEGWEASPVPGAGGEVNGCADVWLLGSLTAARNVALAARLRGVPADRPTTRVQLRIVRSGRVDGIVGGEPVQMGAGDIFFHTDTVPFTLDIVDLAVDVFAIDGIAIGYDPEIHPTFARLPDGTGVAAMVRAMFDAFFDAIEETPAGEAEKMGEVAAALVAGVLGSLRAERAIGPASARQAEMRRYIERNLVDPDLGIERLQAEFPASRAVIYRDFAEEGGLMRYIARRRMGRALSLLTITADDEPIGDIAWQVGYRDQRQFSRAFRRHFGVSPSDTKASFTAIRSGDGPHAQDAASEGTRFRSMLDFSQND